MDDDYEPALDTKVADIKREIKASQYFFAVDVEVAKNVLRC